MANKDSKTSQTPSTFNILLGVGTVASVVISATSLVQVVNNNQQLKEQSVHIEQLTKLANNTSPLVVELHKNMGSNISADNLQAAMDDYFKAQKQKQVEAEKAKYQAIAEENQAQWKNAHVSQNDTYIFGEENSRFTITEYTDFECPYCKRFHDTPLAVVEAAEGSVNWELKHLPLSFHGEIAVQEAMLAECAADQGGAPAFFTTAKLIFDKTRTNGGGADMAQVAREAGLNAQLALECVESNKYRSKVASQAQEANELGITGTPASIITDNVTGNQVSLSGAVRATEIISSIKRLAEKALSEAAATGGDSNNSNM